MNENERSGLSPSVGRSFHCEFHTTLRGVPVANSQSGRRLGRVAVPTVQRHNPLIVPGGSPSIQSLPVWRNSLGIFDELPHGRGTGQVAGLPGGNGTGPE